MTIRDRRGWYNKETKIHPRPTSNLQGSYLWPRVYIKPDRPIHVYTRFCLNTAKSKFSPVSPVAD